MNTAKPRYIDAHSQPHFSDFDNDRDEVLARMRERGVWTIAVGTNLATSRAAVALAEANAGIFATVGTHPTDRESGFDEAAFAALAESARVVAAGECGLDYFREPRELARKKQEPLFRAQIAFALARDLPLMLHCRPSRGTMDAYEDTLEILGDYPGARGDAHFFVGTTAVAKRFLERGFTLSFDGPITFARDYDEVVRYTPLDMLLAETDAPFAAPAPYRGTRNEPAYVAEVVAALARIRGESEEVVRLATVRNAIRVFNLDGARVHS